jgi:hypothetical protein
MKINSGIVALVTVVFIFLHQAKAQPGATNHSRTGYNTANYFYYPEIDTWYDIPNRRFVYFENNRWVYSDAISTKYRYYDIANAYRVAVDEKKPYLHADAYRAYYIDYYNAYQNRFRNRGVLTRAGIDNDDDRINTHRPVFVEPSTKQEGRRIEENQIPGSKTPNENKISTPTQPEEVSKPERFEEHKPIERGEILSPEKTGRLGADSKKEIRATEAGRTRIEPVKKETPLPVKVQEPVKTDSVPVINRLPVGTRDAQYSDKFKKRVEEQ